MQFHSITIRRLQLLSLPTRSESRLRTWLQIVSRVCIRPIDIHSRSLGVFGKCWRCYSRSSVGAICQWPSNGSSPSPIQHVHIEQCESDVSLGARRNRCSVSAKQSGHWPNATRQAIGRSHACLRKCAPTAIIANVSRVQRLWQFIIAAGGWSTNELALRSAVRQ